MLHRAPSPRAGTGTSAELTQFTPLQLPSRGLGGCKDPGQLLGKDGEYPLPVKQGWSLGARQKKEPLPTPAPKFSPQVHQRAAEDEEGRETSLRKFPKGSR